MVMTTEGNQVEVLGTVKRRPQAQKHAQKHAQKQGVTMPSADTFATWSHETSAHSAHPTNFKPGVELDQNRILNLGIPILRALRRYHQHEVNGMDLIPKTGPVLLVVNHSLATYDIFLLLLAIYEDLERLPRVLADRLFFKIPLLRDLITLFGAVQGSPGSAGALLKSGELVSVAPGGMREALRPSRQKYEIRWTERHGFARLALVTQSPVILAACPKADDMYHVYPSYLTSWFYKTYKIPFFFARGWKFSPMPNPVKLVHYVSAPIIPPKIPFKHIKSGFIDKNLVSEFHKILSLKMERLIQTGVDHEKNPPL